MDSIRIKTKNKIMLPINEAEKYSTNLMPDEQIIEKETRRKGDVAELENELKELKKSLEVRQKNKRQIIERRIQELLEEDEYLEWD